MSAQTNNAAARGEEQQEVRHPLEKQLEGGRPVAEWVSFGFAAVILIFVAGLVFYLWWSFPSTPPVVTVVQTGVVRRVGTQFYVPFTITNSGGLTAESVTVRAELNAGGEVVVESEQEFTFLSGGETEQGEFVFEHDPRAGELRLYIGGYRLP